MKTEYKYIKFVQTTLIDKWNCLNKKSNDELGSVFYYKQWNQFVFEPYELGDIVFNNSCLRDIAHFLDQLNTKSKAVSKTILKSPAASGAKQPATSNH